MRKHTNFSYAHMWEVYKLRFLMRETAEYDREPHGECVPSVTGGQAGQLPGPAQPVTDGVGVHEQQPRRRLQGAALLQVRRDGIEQRGTPGQQRLVDGG